MPRPRYWKIEQYDYSRCDRPAADYESAVALHTHSYHSEESLGTLNRVMELPVLRSLNDIFRKAFREKAKEELDYSNLHYCPPISPEEVYDIERAHAEEMGFKRTLIAITDHDKIAACQELIEARPEIEPQVAISEELSFRYDGQEFHLGVIGIPKYRADEHHKNLQDLARHRDTGGLFDLLASLRPRPLVILNHPYYQLDHVPEHDRILMRMLADHGAGIDAVEFNGLRPRKENEAAMDLARSLRLPVIGGGDRHSPLPSLVITATHKARTIDEFIEEVKGGEATAICSRDYFLPHSWKLFVRILHYVRYYRQITFYKKLPITDYPIDDRIIPDYFADAAGFILGILRRFGLVR